MPTPSAQDAFGIIQNYNAVANQALVDNANTLSRQIALNNADVTNRQSLNNVDTQGKLAQNALDKQGIDLKLATNSRQPALLNYLQGNNVAQHDALKVLLGDQMVGANRTYDIAGRQFTSDTADARRLGAMQGRDLRWDTAANGALMTQGYGLHQGDINSALVKQLGDYDRSYEGAGNTHNTTMSGLVNQGINADLSYGNQTANYMENMAGVEDTNKNLFLQMMGANVANDSINRSAPLNNALLANQAAATNANLNQSLSNNQANFTGQLAGQALEGQATGAKPTVAVKKPANSNLFGFKKP